MQVSTEEYNYKQFPDWFHSSVLKKLKEEFQTNLKVGTKAPDFEAVTADGYRVRLSDFKDKANVVLEFGCSTCPPFVNSVKYSAISMEKMYNEYRGKGFEFFLVYIREAHPGELIQAHSSYEDKMKRAKELGREEEISIPILVDTLDGQLHRAYGMRANSAFVINRQGTLVFKSEWADPLQIKDVVDNLLEWENALKNKRQVYLSYSETLRAMDTERWADLEIKRKVLHRAGTKSIKDWKEMLHDTDPI